MLSATDFLPLFITMLMKRAISWLPCLGSGRIRRAGCEPLRDMFFVRFFRGHPCPHEKQPSWPPNDSRNPCPPGSQPSWPHSCIFAGIHACGSKAAIEAAPADAFAGFLPANPKRPSRPRSSIERLINGAAYFLGRLAPYFERDWRRLVTPAQSRLPRTVW